MKQAALRTTAIAVATLLTAGCAEMFNPDGFDQTVTFAGANQVVGPQGFDNINVPSLICEYLPTSEITHVVDGTSWKACQNIKPTSEALQAAYAAFARSYRDDGDANKVRNPGSPAVVSEAQARATALQSAVKTAKTTADTLATAASSSADTKVKSLSAAVKTSVSAAETQANGAVTSAGNASNATDEKVRAENAEQAIAKMRLAQISVEQASVNISSLSSLTTLDASLKDQVAAANQDITTALAAAKIGASVGSSTAGRAYRTNIQEAIVAAADRRCEIYKTTIARAKSSGTFWFSAAATAAGTAGALVSGGIAPYLSGAAGAISGIGASADQAVFQGQLIDLLIAGIDMSREEWRRTILDPKRDVSLHDYPVEQAIGLAMQYSGQCSMATALHTVKNKLNNKTDKDEVTRGQLATQYRMRCVQEAAIKNDNEDAYSTCKTKAEKYLEALGGTTTTTSSTSTTSTK